MTRGADRLAQFRDVINGLASRYLDAYVRQLSQREAPPEPREFNDPVWGTIVASSPEVTVIDSPLFQRLQDIRQLGTAHHVYRSANHTRFEHSLGSLHAMTVLVREINESILQHRLAAVSTPAIQEPLVSHLRMAALLHDIGHGLMSHVSENAIRSLGWAMDLVAAAREDINEPTLGEGKKPAELASYYVVHSPAFRSLAAYLSSDCSFGSVSNIISDISRAILGLPIADFNPFLGQLLSGPFDVDKLDYIQRDAYFCGVPEVIDVNRLLRKLRTTVRRPSELPANLAHGLIDAPEHVVVTGIAESGARTLDEFALARSLLTDKVYRHQKTRAQEALVGSVLEILSELSTRPISIMWSITDSDFSSLSLSALAERTGVVATTRAARRRLELALRLRDRYVDRCDHVAAFVWSADRGRDDLLDADHQAAGIDQLREHARRSSARHQLIAEIGRAVRDIYAAVGDPVPIVKAAADLKYVIRIDQSDDPARLKGRALLARAFLITDAGDVVLFSDEYPGTEDWSDLYLVNRDFSAVFCPRELAAATRLASEVVFYRRYGLNTTTSMVRLAHVNGREVDELKQRLAKSDFYSGALAALRPPPAVLRRATAQPRLAGVASKLAEFNSGLAVKLGLSIQERSSRLSATGVSAFLRQLASDSSIEPMLATLEHLRMFTREDLVKSVVAAFSSFGVSADSVVVAPLGEPDESSGAVTYLVKDELQALGVAFERIDNIHLSDRPNIVLLDDFIGLGSRTVGILQGWLGEGPDARPVPMLARDRLRKAQIMCAYAVGLPGAQDRVRQKLAGSGLEPLVYVHDDAPPRLDDVTGLPRTFRAAIESLGTELLRRNKGRSSAESRANALGYGGHGLLVCFPWGAPKQTLTPLWLSGQLRDGHWRALIPRRD